jgi:LmbE family N-acetylglucosaminyl deacetylase
MTGMPSVVLAVGAHPDDIELGCGGALLAHRDRGDGVHLLVLTTGEQGPQAAMSRISEQERAADALGATLHWGGFHDGSIPDGRQSIQAIESVLREIGADVLYAPAPADTHQDHRATAAATAAAGRRTSHVLFYESPTSIAFAPTIYVDIEEHLEGKLRAIRAHTSQVLKNHLVDLEAVEAQARYHGFHARIRSAEGFQGARFVWNLSKLGNQSHRQQMGTPIALRELR